MKNYLKHIKYGAALCALLLAGGANAAYGPAVNISNDPTVSNFASGVGGNGDVVWEHGFGISVYKPSTGLNTQITSPSGSDISAGITSINAKGDFIFYSSSSTTQICDLYLRIAATSTTKKLNSKSICATLNSFYFRAVLNANGDAVWTEPDAASTATADIYLYKASNGITTNISNTSFDNYFPWLYANGDVAYVQATGTVPATKIRRYSAATLTTADLPLSVTAKSFWSNETGDLAWRFDVSATESHIFRYDRVANVVTQITPADNLIDGHPDISANGDIAWVKFNNVGVLHYYKKSTNTTHVVQQTSNDLMVMLPNADVLFGSRDPVGGDHEIYIFRNSTLAIENISNNTGDDFIDSYRSINARGDFAWRTYATVGGQADIFVYNAATRLVDRVTNTSSVSEGLPILGNNGEVAFSVSIPQAGSEVFYAKPAAAGAPAITSFTATPSTITAGSSTVLSWNSTNTTSCTMSGGSNE